MKLLSFSDALDSIKEGKLVSKKSWPLSRTEMLDKDEEKIFEVVRFVKFKPAVEASKNTVYVKPMLLVQTVQGQTLRTQSFDPSSDDVLSDDWFEVEKVDLLEYDTSVYLPVVESSDDDKPLDEGPLYDNLVD